MGIGDLIKRGILVIVVLIIATAAFGSWYNIDQGERGIVLRWGKVTNISNPGLNFKIPIIEKIEKMSVRTQNLQFEKMSAYSEDTQQAELRISINFHLSPDMISQIYEKYGTSIVSTYISPRIFGSVKDIFGVYKAADIVVKREEIQDKIFSRVQELLGKNGAVIESVQIENIDFSDEYERAIEIAMKMKAAEMEAHYAAQRDIKKATGLADAEVQRARGIKAIADAEAHAIRVKGDALAAAPKLPMLIASEKWDGKLPTSMIPNGALPFLDLTTKNN